MAQDPDRPLDDGRIRLPRIDGAMNKVAPAAGPGGKGSEDDDNPIMLRPGPVDRDEAEVAEIVARARKRWELAAEAESDNRYDGIDDDKNYAGDQWPYSVLQDRQNERRPIITINKLPTFVHQVTNEQRMNRPAINVSPVGDRGDPDAAEIWRGLIRAIERESNADIAYDTAFESAVRKGWGYWRITTEYEGQDSFDQRLVVKRIRNAYSVYLDPNHQEPDGSDAKWAFVSEMITRDEFNDRWPDADPMSWDGSGVGEGMKEWITEDSVRIAEYYELEYEKRTLVQLVNGHVGWKDELAKDHPKITAERESDCPRITWYKLTAKEILEETPWPGRWIPIVKVIGDEIDIEGKVMLWGIVRFAKDPQRMYNYWSTSETELIALAPKAPWVVAEGQDDGYEQEWKTANVRSHPVLHYKPTSLDGTLVPPPSRQPFAGSPQGVVAAKQGAAQDMMATTGIRFDATLQERMYDESGRALRELRQRGDLGWWHFMDNLARSLRHTGNIFIDVAPFVYDTKRVVTILREDDSEEMVQIDPNAPKAVGETKSAQGKVIKAFNPTVGKYGVTVTIGPSFATKRVEAAESMMDFARALPNAAALIMDLIAKNQDWPGAEEMATRLAKAVPPQFLSPEIKDVPPQVQAILASLDQQVKQLTTERTAMMSMIQDQTADRAQRQDKIDKDFESTLAKIIADVETKMAATQERATANFNTHIGAQIKDLAEATRLLRDSLVNPERPNGGMING